MPTVPQYGLPQVSAGALPAARASAPQMPDVQGQQMGQVAHALDQTARATAAIEQQANQIRVIDATNQGKTAAVEASAAFQQLQGEETFKPDADGRMPIDVQSDALKQRLDKIIEGLGNDQQRMAFQMQAGQILQSFRGDATRHQGVQFGKYRDGVFDSTIATAGQQLVASWNDPDAVAQGEEAIKAAVAAKAHGLGGEFITQQQDKTLSAAHAQVVAALLDQQNTDGAQAYFDQHKDTINATTRAKLQETLGKADVSSAAIKGADQIWSEIGPNDDKPLDVFAMDKRARELYADNPAKIKATIAEIHERASSWNSAETARNADAISTVYQDFQGGKSLAQIRQSKAFQTLPGDKQEQIIEHIQSTIRTRQSYDIADRNKAQAELATKNYSTYMALTANPDTLAAMSPADVMNLRPVLGDQLTENLIQKRNALQKPEKMIDARMDTDDFNQVADQMGLRPFDPKKSEQERAALGQLKYRVEQLIDGAQTTAKRPLTREEKLRVMSTEMARTVTVDGGWFGSDKQVPVIQLGADQAGKVKVPDADRAQIVQALRNAQQRDPGNPNYAPTEANVTRMYLRGKSAAGSLVNVK